MANEKRKQIFRFNFTNIVISFVLSEPYDVNRLFKIPFFYENLPLLILNNMEIAYLVSNSFNNICFCI